MQGLLTHVNETRLAEEASRRIIMAMFTDSMAMNKEQTTDAPMSSEDHRIEGALGTLSMAIRENGTGEIIFALGGTRRCAGARSSDRKPIEKGAEVVIERYEKGLAYVKRWEEFSK